MSGQLQIPGTCIVTVAWSSKRQFPLGNPRGVTDLISKLGGTRSLLVGLEDLERSNDLGKRGRAVGSPLLVILLAVNVDDEVVRGALEVDERLSNTATSHVVRLYERDW